jgi:hypothetical protein
MRMPWFKCYRNILNDETMAFLMRRYGHETLTFWVGLMSQVDQDSGRLELDEDILADLCQLEEKRYAEIRGIFLKYKLVVEEDKKLVIVNWKEKQQGDSTERVRRHRERQKDATGDETLPKRECNADETGEEEEEEEREEEEDEEKRIPPAPVKAEKDQQQSQPPHFAVAAHWYARYAKATARLISPSEKDNLRGLELFRRVSGDMALVDQAIGVYFTNWQDLWYARKGKAPPYQADFSFASFCSHIDALLAETSAPTPEAPPADLSAAQAAWDALPDGAPIDEPEEEALDA